MNEAAANSFIVVVQKELVQCHLYISSFLPSILHGIESRDVGEQLATDVYSVYYYCVC